MFISRKWNKMQRNTEWTKNHIPKMTFNHDLETVKLAEKFFGKAILLFNNKIDNLKWKVSKKIQKLKNHQKISAQKRTKILQKIKR